MSTAEPGRRPPHRVPRAGLARLTAILAMVSGPWLLAATPARAHPVSQGKLEIAVAPDLLRVRITVSSEEVLIASTAPGRGRGSALEIRRTHGDYILGHLHVEAGGRPLAGRVVGRPEILSGRPTYTIEFPFPAPRPARLTFREDMLREVEFAPGIAWEATYVVRIGREGRQAGGATLLTAREPLDFSCDWGADSPAPAAREPGRTPGEYRTTLAFLRLGFHHILTGYDHLLFVAALLLAARSLGDLVAVITAFTLAHTLTLGVAALDLVRLPDRIVEPMIAASIVIVAAQNIARPGRSRGGGRLLVAFLFGLFHGLGFAGGLLEAASGLGRLELAGKIAAFSAGVEIGHQVVVLPAFALLCLLRRKNADRPGRDRLVELGGSAVVLLLGAAYLVAALGCRIPRISLL